LGLYLPNGITSAQLAALKPTFSVTNSGLYVGSAQQQSGTTAQDFTAVYELIDKKSFVDFWLLLTLCGNIEILWGDAGVGNFYCYKPRNGKLIAGPPWDFDYSTYTTEEFVYRSKQTVLAGDNA
jgi:hypothetical protein